MLSFNQILNNMADGVRLDNAFFMRGESAQHHLIFSLFSERCTNIEGDLGLNHA